MMGEIAQAFVRIRPNTAGFKSEAEAGVKSSLLGIGKAVGGIFAVTGAVEAVKTVAEAATQHQAAFARLEQVTHNVGAATNLYGQSLEKLLEKEARVKGFSDEELAQSFLRILAATHDSAKAYRDLGLAQDISAATGKDLTISALALAKAEQGSVTSLTRLGIIVPKVGVAVGELTKQHDQLAAAGVKFTKQQDLEYNAQLAQAKAIDDTARKTLALTLVSQRYGGVAEHLAKTTSAGQFRTFRQELHQLEVEIGNALIPSLAHGAKQAGEFFNHLRESGSAAKEAHQVMHDLGVTFHLFAEAVKIVGPPLGLAVHGLVLLANTGIGGPILAIAVGMKAISVGAGLAAGTVGRLAKILPVIAVEEEAIIIAGNPFALIAAGGLAAAFGVYKLVGAFKDMQKEQDRFDNALTTKRALALDYYSHRVKALEKNLHLSAAAAQKLANEDTFKHTGIRIHPTGDGGAVDAVKQDAAKQAEVLKVGLKAVETNIASAKTVLAKATYDLSQANTNLADTIRSGNQQITDSIRSAESNLASIGDSLAASIDEFMAKTGMGGAGSPQSAAFKRLRNQIATGSEAPGARAAASALANQIQQSQAVAANQGATAKRQIADLVAQFNQGSISLATFNRRVAGMLAKDGISYKRAGQVLGIAFAQGFRAQVEGLREQAGAIAATPGSRRRGMTGQEPSIIRPLETIRQVSQQIAQAQRARDEKALEVARDQRRLNGLEEQHTRLLRQESGSQTRLQRSMDKHLGKIAAESGRQTALERRQLLEQRRQAAKGAAVVGAQVGREMRDVTKIGGP